MSNYRFIQVDPPKEQLTLPSRIVDFAISSTAITEELLTFTFTSTSATFTGVSSKDLLQMSFVDPNTFIETFMCIVEVASVASVNEITTSVLNTSIPEQRKIITEISEFRSKDFQRLYKLPTNNISVQVRTDNITRYYQDPEDDSIMYIDLDSNNDLCSSLIGNQNTYGEFKDYGAINTLALTSTYTDWTSGSIGENNNITMTSSPNTFTIVTPGVYRLESSICMSSSVNNVDISCVISKNGAALLETEGTGHFQSSGLTGTGSKTHLLDLAAGDQITLSFKSNINTTITINNISLNMNLLSASSGSGSGSSNTDIWGFDRSNPNIVTLNNTNKLPYHNIVPYLNSIFLDS
jgi:hypothetical protein